MNDTTSNQVPSEMENTLKEDEENFILHCSSFGKTDPSTLSLLAKVIEDLIYLRRCEEALDKAKESYKRFCRILGKKNKKTIDALCNIGTIYTWLGMNDEALESYKECYNLSRKVLGKEHPDTSTIKDYIDSMPVQQMSNNHLFKR